MKCNCTCFFSIVVALIFSYATVTAQESLVADKSYVKEIKKLSAKKQIQNAFAILDKIDNQTTADLITLTEIEAPPFKETKRAVAFQAMLDKAGVDTSWIDEVGNVIGLLKGTEGDRVVVLDAHLDTVFPEGTDVTVKKKGDTLYAPGIGDDTRGLAMLLAIAKSIKQAELKPKADLWFVGSVGEEGLGDLRGVKHFFREGAPKIDSWIAIDGGAVGRVNNAGLGSTRYKAVFKGEGGHSWGAFGLANPHHALGYAIKHFTEAAKKYTDEGPKTSFNIGRIGGGTSVNSIPFESWMEVDMRSVEANRLIKMDSIFKTSMNLAVEQYNATGIEDKIELELIKIGDRPSGELPTTTPLVQRAIAATTFFGEQPRLTRGSTNGNIPISLGIPAVTLGRGGKGGGAHSLGEWWMNTDGVKAMKLALMITISEAGLAP